MGGIVSSQAFLPPPCGYTPDLKHLVWIENRLPALYLDYRSLSPPISPGVRLPSSRAPLPPYTDSGIYTMLFSHGNAEDLGCVSAWLKVLCDRCRVSILAYEYRGYGLYRGNPSEEHCYSDISAAYRYLVTERQCDPSRIILFGRSLGSGPTVHLASELYGVLRRTQSKPPRCFIDCSPPEISPSDSPTSPPLAGVILQSPLTSAIAVVSQTLARVLYKIDVFVNIGKIERVRCPVMILHGTADAVVPYSHGEDLRRLCPNLFQFVPIEGAGHNDIESRFTSQYLTALANFLLFLDNNCRENVT